MLAAAGNAKALWYLARGTGLVTLLMLTATMVLGIVGVSRWSSRRWPRFVTIGLHRNLSLLAVAFLAVHIVTVVSDSFVSISWLNAFVPFTGSYHAIWLGLGAVAGDLLIALIVTSLLRRHIGHLVWRAVHVLAYAGWPAAVIHGLTIGTDRSHAWAAGISYACIAAVGGAVAWRASLGRAPITRRQLGAQL